MTMAEINRDVDQNSLKVTRCMFNIKISISILDPRNKVIAIY